MEMPTRSWAELKSDERLRVAIFIWKRGDLENRLADAIEELVLAVSYYRHNLDAIQMLEELRSKKEPR